MKIAQRYKKGVVEDDFDVIVIGSGLGGLTTAALLSKAGKKVGVFERHYVAGGFTHTFKRKGYEWDVGVHYIGEVHNKNSLLRRIFDFITNGRLQWAKMTDAYDKVIMGENSYTFKSGLDNFRKELFGKFPGEEKAIKAYIRLVNRLNRATPAFFATRAMPPLLGKVMEPIMGRKYLQLSNRTVYETISSLTSNQELLGVLSAQWGDYGLPPKEASFAIQAMIARHYFDGASYPIGGSINIARSIVPVIEKSGGKVLTRAEVEEVVIENNKAVGVRLSSGETFHAKTIISSAGIHTTFDRLLPEKLSSMENLRNNARKQKPSSAYLCLYIGMNHSAEELDLKQTNLWIYPSPDHDKNVRDYAENPNADFPVVYISFPSAKDPERATKSPGRSTMEVITVVPYDRFQKWEGTKWKKRGDDYETLKEELSQQLLKVVYRFLPQTAGKIDHYELSTPLTTKNFCNYGKGEMYGLEFSPERFRQKWLRPHTPVGNFFLTGQDIVTNGIGGALMSGVLTASAILSRNLIVDMVGKGKRKPPRREFLPN